MRGRLDIWKFWRPQSQYHFCPTSDSAELLNPGLTFGYLMAPLMHIFSHHEVENILFYKWSNQGLEVTTWSVQPHPSLCFCRYPCAPCSPHISLTDCVAQRPKTFFLIHWFLDRVDGRREERNIYIRETHQSVASQLCPSKDGDRTCNQGTCP